MNKQRPLFVWKNNLINIKNHWLCFYCSSKADKHNENYCVFVSKNKNKGFSSDTYIWLHKPIIVWKYDFISLHDHHNTRPQCEVVDKQLKQQIRDKISLMYNWTFTD